MTIDREAIAAEYASGIMAMANIADTEDNRQRWQAKGLGLIADIESKSERFLQRCLQGLLQPSNKGGRRLFEQVTGLTLPKTQRDTWKVLQRYCGEELSAYEAKLDKQRAEAEAEALRQEQVELEQAIATAKAKVLAKQPIDANDVLILAKHYGFEPHPRTVGTIRARLIEFNANGARIFGGKGLPDKVWYLWYDIRDKVQAKAAT